MIRYGTPCMYFTQTDVESGNIINLFEKEEKKMGTGTAKNHFTSISYTMSLFQGWDDES